MVRNLAWRTKRRHHAEWGEHLAGSTRIPERTSWSQAAFGDQGRPIMIDALHLLDRAPLLHGWLTLRLTGACCQHDPVVIGAIAPTAVERCVALVRNVQNVPEIDIDNVEAITPR